MNMTNMTDRRNEEELVFIHVGEEEAEEQENVELISEEPSEEAKLSKMDFIIFAILMAALLYCYGYFLYVLSKAKN